MNPDPDPNPDPNPNNPNNLLETMILLGYNVRIRWNIKLEYNFVETPHTFIITELSIPKLGSSSVLIIIVHYY